MPIAKLIILDRDGVINQDSDVFIKSPEEWIPLPGSLEAIAQLNQAGYRVVVASNQSGIGRGLFDIATLNTMHSKMHKLLATLGGRVDAVFFCPHNTDDGCTCRKPNSGMFHDIAERFNVDLAGVPVVGDSLRDLQAGVPLGCAPHLVLTGKGSKTQAQANAATDAANQLPVGTQVHANLAAFVKFYLKANQATPAKA